jgi:hypothetical protein
MQKISYLFVLLTLFLTGRHYSSTALMFEIQPAHAHQPIAHTNLGNSEYVARLKLDGWPVDTLNTAAKVSYLSDIEKNMILAMNLIRYNPSKYAELYVKEAIGYYRGMEFHYPGLEYILMTREGVLPATELYYKLKQTSQKPILFPSEGLSLAARSHATYQSRNGQTGHGGQGGMRARIEKFGKWTGRIAENITYGSTSAHLAILSLMIDDGVPDRGHRDNMLNDVLQVAGVAWATHPRFPGGVYVIKYAGGFESN